MIKYIGSKRSLLPHIVGIVRALPRVRRVADLFTGSTRVARALKAAGFEVVANDIATYSAVLARTYVEQDARRVDREALAETIARLDALPDADGYFTETFCRRARYFQPHNGMRVDAIRPAIDAIASDEIEHATLVTALLEAADRVDSTAGVQMAYLKNWSIRSHRRLTLRVPELLEGSGESLQLDAAAAARAIGEVDVCYLDPPYNQHSYYSNYHVWETLVRGDAPEVYGRACKRVDCRTTKSEYNSRVRSWGAFVDLVSSVRARHVLVSFSDEGFFDLGSITGILGDCFGEVACAGFDSRRYIGAQIGVFNLRGERVGDASHLRNTEYLILAGEGAADVLGTAAAAAA